MAKNRIAKVFCSPDEQMQIEDEYEMVERYDALAVLKADKRGVE